MENLLTSAREAFASAISETRRSERITLDIGYSNPIAIAPDGLTMIFRSVVEPVNFDQLPAFYRQKGVVPRYDSIVVDLPLCIVTWVEQRR